MSRFVFDLQARIPLIEKEGFLICFEASDDDSDMEDHFRNDCGWSKEDFEKISHFEWFVAKVTAWRDKQELGCAYMGGLCYETYMDFLEGDAAALNGLIDEAIADAKHKEHYDYRKLAMQDPTSSLLS